eukprot:6680193-Prymnesium_polylepis.1
MNAVQYWRYSSVQAYRNTIMSDTAARRSRNISAVHWSPQTRRPVHPTPLRPVPAVQRIKVAQSASLSP